MTKNIVYFILIICLTTNLFAQNQTSDCKFYLTLNKVEDQSWNSTDNLWYKINTKEFLYDNNGNAIQIINRSFTDLPSGLGNFKLTFTYENNILKTRQRDIWVNDSLLWVKVEKIEFNFSSQGDIISELWMTWSNDSNNWTSYWKKEYSYNDNRYLIEYQSFIKDNTSNQWQLDTKYIYSCDSIGNTIQTINYYQNKTTKELVESGKHEYKFDANGNCILHHAYYKYEDSTTWIKYGKDEYCYDSCNRMTNSQGFTFNDSNNLWNPVSQYDFMYDSLGNLINTILYRLNTKTNELEFRIKSDYRYDLNYTSLDLILPDSNYFVLPIYFTSKNKINYKPVENIHYTWDPINNIWNYSSKNIYYYSVQNSIVLNRLENSILFPNPFSSNLSFQLTEKTRQIIFELYDVNGNKIMVRKINDSETINLQYLNKGIYVYNLYLNNRIQSGKLIKE